MPERLFSIIIPTFKRQDRLGALLDSLCLQSMPVEKWEVVVVDDQSHEDFTEFRSRYSGRMNLSVVLSEVKGRPGARNSGARAAAGEILVFLDDDVTVNGTFIDEYYETHKSNPGCLLVGKIVSEGDETSLWTSVVDMRFDLHQKHLNVDPLNLPFYCVTTGNVSISRELFLKVGGFDEVLFVEYSGEDFDFGKRCADHDIRIAYCHGALAVHHERAYSLGGLKRKLRYFASGIIKLLNKHRDILSDYDNFRSFPVRLGRTHVPEQSTARLLMKKLLCLPPFLEAAGIVAQLFWRFWKDRRVLVFAARIKELLIYRYYLRSARLFWTE
jgi:glycosyltransferase involved in cell wall biosynthesis